MISNKFTYASILFYCFVQALIHCSWAACKTSPATNPVLSGQTFAHDPTLVRLQPCNDYIVYRTADGMGGIRSPSLEGPWKQDRSAFPNGVPWVKSYTHKDNNLDMWAPDISYHNGIYYLYFCASQLSTKNSAIGLATSTTGEPGSFTDHGVIITSGANTLYNAIDPNLFVDPATGRWWITFGSFFGGIYQVEAIPNDGRPKRGAPFNKIAGNAEEAPAIIERGGKYYLFVSTGSCCKTNADASANCPSRTYAIHYGRASSPNGPFIDRRGVNMLNGGGSLLLGRNNQQWGAGGQNVYKDADGKYLLVYHYYARTAANNNCPPTFGIKYLQWTTDDWPYVK
ncbi:glycosyl hydrolases family 43 domain-containing protein [Ditylenchus destructor]|uniref:arabinan endo-1,5-alpha-L-arabinosidase n=1 Tax=Ditylenchus destructor TaxID=166010 RepID=A0AAD4MPM1_9BILA|nr:glycosyl hydrolases family 43 domain-containing protein [Ditylenchus destructor]